MSLPSYIQIHRIGKYPVEKFAYQFSDDRTQNIPPIQLLFTGKSIWCRNVECERRNSPYASLELIQEGCFELIQENDSICARPGELLLLHPDVQTRLICRSEIGRKYVFAFCGALLPEILESMGILRMPHVVPPRPEIWESFAGEAELLFRKPDNQTECALFAYRLLLELRGLNELQSYPQPLRMLLRFIARNLPHAPQLSDLVRESGRSQAGLYRLFQRHLHCSPMDYIRETRLCRAAELLRLSDSSVKEIADLLCYSSPQYFAGEFRKKYKASPRDYRRKIREQKDDSSAGPLAADQ